MAEDLLILPLIDSLMAARGFENQGILTKTAMIRYNNSHLPKVRQKVYYQRSAYLVMNGPNVQIQYVSMDPDIDNTANKKDIRDPATKIDEIVSNVIAWLTGSPVL